jgi:hypothetical protein
MEWTSKALGQYAATKGTSTVLIFHAGHKKWWLIGHTKDVGYTGSTTEHKTLRDAKAVGEKWLKE